MSQPSLVRVRSSLLAGLLAGVSAAALLLACGGTDDETNPLRPDAGSDSGRLTEPFRPAGRPCEVIIESPPLLPSPHVTEGSTNTYNSTPPSSGPHYPQWANFQEHATPIEDGYLVHSLEHGAVAIFHQPLPQQADLSRLRQIRDAIPTEPICDPAIRVRVIIAPRADPEFVFTAAAWGWTYKARCLDAETLSAFVQDHIGRGPENICAAGRTF